MMIVHAAKPLFAWDCPEDSRSLQAPKDLLAALLGGRGPWMSTAIAIGVDTDYPRHQLSSGGTPKFLLRVLIAGG
jgi:hypothetical protein